jgi:hypothetical protein
VSAGDAFDVLYLDAGQNHSSGSEAEVGSCIVGPGGS